jgi:hypothetical protein
MIRKKQTVMIPKREKNRTDAQRRFLCVGFFFKVESSSSTWRNQISLVSPSTSLILSPKPRKREKPARERKKNCTDIIIHNIYSRNVDGYPSQTSRKRKEKREKMR